MDELFSINPLKNSTIHVDTTSFETTPRAIRHTIIGRKLLPFKAGTALFASPSMIT
jgi:hypothetical protein